MTSFREQWQREIEKSPQKDGKLSTKDLAGVLPETENFSAIETKVCCIFLSHDKITFKFQISLVIFNLQILQLSLIAGEKFISKGS